MSFVPGLGIVKGMALTLRRFFEPKVTHLYPEDPGPDPAASFRGRLQLLYDEYGTLKCETCFQCAQACPIECIDMGGVDTKNRFAVHWGASETYGERREESALRRSGRTVPGPGLRALPRRRPGPRRRDPRRVRPRPEGDAPDPRRDPGRVWLRPGRGAQAGQRGDRCVVRDALRHGDVLRPPGRRRGGDRSGRPPTAPSWARSTARWPGVPRARPAPATVAARAADDRTAQDPGPLAAGARPGIRSRATRPTSTPAVRAGAFDALTGWRCAVDDARPGIATVVAVGPARAGRRRLPDRDQVARRRPRRTARRDTSSPTAMAPTRPSRPTGR